MYKRIFLNFQTNEVSIDDMRSETLSNFLEFLYTDQCKGISENACELLIAAEKYDVPRLKAMCEEAIAHNLNVSNAATVNFLGYMHQAENLKKEALDFVTLNLKEVMKNPGWKIIAESHPEIMNDILMAKLEVLEL